MFFGLRSAYGIDTDALGPYTAYCAFEPGEEIGGVEGVVFVDDHGGFRVVGGHGHGPSAENGDFGDGAIG